jgi:glucitol/sorbitol PTS system EIIB component
MGLLDRFKKKTDDAAEEVKQAADVPTAPAVPADDGAVGVATERAGDAAPAEAETVASGEYRTVHINPGKRGWGSGFDVEFKPGKDLVYSVTGGGIHPVAQRIADLSGGKPFDGFKSKAGFEEIAVAVIDCGGTARIGVYPMKGVLTVDIHGASPSGPLVRFITEDNFVSGVTPDDVEVVEG